MTVKSCDTKEEREDEREEEEIMNGD